MFAKTQKVTGKRGTLKNDERVGAIAELASNIFDSSSLQMAGSDLINQNKGAGNPVVSSDATNQKQMIQNSTRLHSVEVPRPEETMMGVQMKTAMMP